MSKFDEQYLDLCDRILREGERVVNYHKQDTRGATSGSTMPDHAAQGATEQVTIRIPHQVLQFDLGEEFPILTTKFVPWKSAIIEMLWIFQAQSNDVRWLHDRGVKIWDEWEIGEDGKYLGKRFGKEYAHTIGTAYGWVVKKYKLTQSLIETLKSEPGNRRMVLSLWQNEFLPTAALPSCVWNSQWNIVGGKLNVLVTSRSTDVPLGLPFNITQYATFCYLIAQVVGVQPGRLTFVTNDAHIYENQVPGITEQIFRAYRKLRDDGALYPAPQLWLNPDIKDFFKFDNSKELKDIQLLDYQHQGKIKMPIAQ